MGRKARLFLPLDVLFYDDDRVIAMGDGPTHLYLAMCLKTKAIGSDGRLSEAQVSRLGRTRWKAELARLIDVEAVLWDDETKFYVISAWFGHNEPISLIEAKRAADRERKRLKALDDAEKNNGRPP